MNSCNDSEMNYSGNDADDVDSGDCGKDAGIPQCTKEASTIKAIDKGSVHRICSGQVVLTLATAVKELVENSVDAGATSVDVRLKEYGSSGIEVNDNGCGVEEINFEGLTLKHHTSKLQDFDDLINVTTFGFRGEALSSLCALSNMVIITRHKSASVGTRLEFDLNGKIVSRKSVPRQVGTTVQIQNIFHTLPVRHKEFQRNLKKEFAKLVQVLNAYCIVNTGVRITCSNQSGKGSRNTVVSTNGNETMKENIANVFSPKQLHSLLEFKQSEAGDEVCSEFGVKPQQKCGITFRIEGFVSKCEHGQGRSSSDRQFLFINKRPCDATKIFKVINEVYHSYNRHQNPFIALNVTMNKESVDVNVTPDKRQIFLEGEKLLLAVLKTSLIEMFEPTTSVYKVNNFVSSTQPGLRSNGKEDHVKSSRAFSSLGRVNCESDECDRSTLSSSLSKLKRSFTSAFARNDSNSSPSVTSPGKKSKIGSLAFTRLHSLPSQSHTSDRGSITHFLSRFSPKKSQSLPSQSNLSSSVVVTPLELVSPARSSSDLSVFSSVSSTPDIHCSDEHVLLDSNLPDNNSESGITNGCVKDIVATANQEDVERECEDRTHSFSTQGQGKDEDQTPSGDPDSDFNIAGNKPELNEIADGRLKAEKVNITFLESPRQEFMVETRGSATESNNKENKGTENFHKYDSSDGEQGNLAYVIDKDLDDDEKEISENREQTIHFSLSRLKEKMKTLTLKEADSRGSFSRSFRAKICPGDNKSAEDELQREISKEMFPKMEILGQFNLGFIITKLGSDLFIVDQHATDEKYNFEMLQKHTVLKSQKLIIPQSLELTASNETILLDNLEVFKKNGFDFIINPEAPPTQRIKLASAPVSKNWSFGKDDIEELIFMLTDSPNVMCRPTRVRMMFASRACRKSIMIGTALNKSEMKRLVSHMAEIEQPWNCPHGRPTMRHLFNMEMLPS